jgi:methionyl-tRNA formyltransferase
MQMDAGLDTGPVLAQRALDIAADEDAGSLHDRLACLGADMMVDALRQIEAGTAQPQPQPAAGATYAAKISKSESVLDWSRPAGELERVVRALRPAPGASTSLNGETLKIWRASPSSTHGSPGQVLTSGPTLLVGCGEGALEILELQRAGGKRLDAEQFLRGYPLKPGARFG